MKNRHVAHTRLRVWWCECPLNGPGILIAMQMARCQILSWSRIIKSGGTQAREPICPHLDSSVHVSLSLSFRLPSFRSFVFFRYREDRKAPTNLRDSPPPTELSVASLVRGPGLAQYHAADACAIRDTDFLL